MISFCIYNDVIKENYLGKHGLHLTNKGSFLLLNKLINYSNENKNNSILLMNKGCDIEENIDIKEHLVQVSKERCSISQNLIYNSNSSIKTNTECTIELKKFRINN